MILYPVETLRNVTFTAFLGTPLLNREKKNIIASNYKKRCLESNFKRRGNSKIKSGAATFLVERIAPLGKRVKVEKRNVEGNTREVEKKSVYLFKLI